MNKLLTIILTFFSIISYSQEISFHSNLRNAKDTSLFDYWIGTDIKFNVDSIVFVIFGANFERDNAKNYYSVYNIHELKYGKLKIFKDTEKDIEFVSLSIYKPFKYTKIGIDVIHSNKFKYAAYLALNYKFIQSELSFNDKIEKFELKFTPGINKDKFYISYDLNLLYFDKKTKWNSGITIKYIIL